MVEERPNKFGLVYVQYYGENFTAMKALEIVQRRTFFESSNPQTCQVCFQVECHFLKPMMKQDVCRHAAYGEQEISDSYQYINTDVGLQKRAGTSSSSSPQEGKKYGHAKKHLRYNSSYS